jgi:hypothetical protein
MSLHHGSLSVLSAIACEKQMELTVDGTMVRVVKSDKANPDLILQLLRRAPEPLICRGSVSDIVVTREIDPGRATFLDASPAMVSRKDHSAHSLLSMRVFTEIFSGEREASLLHFHLRPGRTSEFSVSVQGYGFATGFRGELTCVGARSASFIVTANGGNKL